MKRKNKGYFSDWRTIRVQTCITCPLLLIKDNYCTWYGATIYNPCLGKPIKCKLSWNPWEHEDNTIYIYPWKSILIGAEHKKENVRN